MNKKGIALIFIFVVIVVLLILGAAMLSRSISESRLAKRYEEAAQAFWLAEAGVNRALDELRNNYNLSGTGLWITSLDLGQYSVDVAIDGQNRIVTAHGFIPSIAQARAERIIEVVISKSIPPDFYGNAIYAAEEVDLNGSSYSVTGNVRYGETIDNTENVDGTITHDPTISPLARLDFQQLRDQSSAQGNLYIIDPNPPHKLVNSETGSEGFPSSFWYTEPTNPEDPTTGVPNIVYVEGDLQLGGEIGTVGGFFVVAGDVITNPSGTYDADINGNGEIAGAIYTRGEFRINGGGNGLNINGGVWSGGEAELNGNADIAYNEDYMSAIQALNIDASAQITSWKDLQNLYPLTP